MICEGCPMQTLAGLCAAFGGYIPDDNCHLTPTDITIIRAMIAGTWKCESCIHLDYCQDLVDKDCPVTSMTPCKVWQLKGGTR